MFAFSVVRNSDGKVGSIVSQPIPYDDGGLYVVVMWDDDFTFSTELVEELTGNPINMPKEREHTLVSFPGGKKDDGSDTTH